MTARSIVVYGASGHGKVVADAARSQGYELRGFIDDAPERAGSTLWGVPVHLFADFIGAREKWWPGVQVALGVGSNGARQRCHGRLRDAGVSVATVVHASAVVAPTATIGEGTVIMAGAVVNPDAKVGAGCIINTGSVVEHDCVLGDYVHLSPNVALGGAVRIGERTHLGLGAVAIPGTRIGSDVTVGAGAAVIGDTESLVTLVGVPAKPVRKREQP
jgi:sugar O-acyltransferase (sialic acid O-acetyltransferase NeuD family)